MKAALAVGGPGVAINLTLLMLWVALGFWPAAIISVLGALVCGWIGFRAYHDEMAHRAWMADFNARWRRDFGAEHPEVRR